MIDRNGPLITDPGQAVLIVDLLPKPRKATGLLALRIPPLIELACSMRADVEIPGMSGGEVL